MSGCGKFDVCRGGEEGGIVLLYCYCYCCLRDLES